MFNINKKISDIQSDIYYHNRLIKIKEQQIIDMNYIINNEFIQYLNKNKNYKVEYLFDVDNQYGWSKQDDYILVSVYTKKIKSWKTNNPLSTIIFYHDDVKKLTPQYIIDNIELCNYRNCGYDDFVIDFVKNDMINYLSKIRKTKIDSI